MATKSVVGIRWVLLRIAGAAIVLLIIRGAVFLYGVLFHATANPQTASLAVFQRDYPLLHGELATVATSTSLTGRLVQAWALGMAAAVLVWLLCMVAKPSEAGCKRLIRGALVVVLAWATYAALFLPVMLTQATRGQLVITERGPHIGNITFPFTAKQRVVPATRIDRITEGVLVDHDGAKSWLYYVAGDTTETIGIVRNFSPERKVELLTASSTAAAAMERELR